MDCPVAFSRGSPEGQTGCDLIAQVKARCELCTVIMVKVVPGSGQKGYFRGISVGTDSTVSASMAFETGPMSGM